jgi:hypothetical protein
MDALSDGELPPWWGYAAHAADARTCAPFRVNSAHLAFYDASNYVMSRLRAVGPTTSVMREYIGGWIGIH